MLFRFPFLEDNNLAGTGLSGLAARYAALEKQLPCHHLYESPMCKSSVLHAHDHSCCSPNLESKEMQRQCSLPPVKLCLILGSTLVLVLDPEILGRARVAEFRAICSQCEQVEKQIRTGLE